MREQAGSSVRRGVGKGCCTGSLRRRRRSATSPSSRWLSTQLSPTPPPPPPSLGLHCVDCMECCTFLFGPGVAGADPVNYCTTTCLAECVDCKYDEPSCITDAVITGICCCLQRGSRFATWAINVILWLCRIPGLVPEHICILARMYRTMPGRAVELLLGHCRSAGYLRRC